MPLKSVPRVRTYLWDSHRKLVKKAQGILVVHLHKAVVCDGHVGLLQAVTSCPVQMFQFHLLQIIRRLLINKPHLPAGIELRALMRKYVV